MGTEKDNEELIKAFAKAAGAAFLSLKETTREHFYFYVFVFDQGLHPYISAWSYEALEKSIIEQQISDEEKSWWKMIRACLELEKSAQDSYLPAASC